MIRFHDGPASDYTLGLRAAPLLLRVVIDLKGNVDALDQSEDRPSAAEQVFVYVRCGEPFCGFIDWSDGKGRRGEPFVNAEYRLLHFQPSDSVVRDQGYWRAFADGFNEEASLREARIAE